MTVVQDADEQRSAAAAAVAPGTVLAWGANDAGQLGDGMTNTSSTPVWVRNLTGVIWVSAAHSTVWPCSDQEPLAGGHISLRPRSDSVTEGGAEQMDEREVRELLDRLLAAMDPAQEFEARHEDFTVEFPQSGERMNRGGLRSMQEVYPGGAPSIRLRRLVGAGDVWIAETAGRYGDGSVWHGVDIIEFRDGKIWKETRYWAEPFEAPEWRAQWVEGTEGT